MIHFLEQAEKIIKMDSVSKNGNEEIAVHLQQLMTQMGFKTQLQEVTHSVENVSKRQFNLLGILGDPLVDITTKKGLLLNTHLDTVSPGVLEHWTETEGDPFQAKIKDRKIYGLGSADVKLDFLCKLKACEKYRDRKLKMPIYLVGTAGEEIGMFGAKFLIKSKALNPKYVLVGEPSELSVIYAHKAYCVYQVQLSYNQHEKDSKGYNTRIEIKCSGKSTHGSYPHLGDSAIAKMLNVIQQIKAANFQLRLSRIGGGDSVNKVPDTAQIEFYLASSSFDDFKQFYLEKLQDKSIQVEFGGVGEAGMKFLPENILEAIASVQQTIQDLKQGILNSEDPTFNPATSTVNFGKIVQQPGGLQLWYDIRLLPTISAEAFDQAFKAEIAKANAKYPSMVMKVVRGRFNPSLNMSETSELVMAAKQAQESLKIGPKLDKKATSTEAAQYFAAGYDAIVFGPGKSMGNSHTPNEYNYIDHLDHAVHFYDRMIERFCIGG